MTNKAINPELLLKPVCRLAKRAGEEIIKIYDKDFTVMDKADGSPLTTADTISHQVIVQGLQDISPDIPILSEEADDLAYEQRRHWSYFWLVDPLDGTKEFINRNGEFTVNIALIYQGQPILGVVYVPVSAVLYYGCAGQGAFRQVGNEEPEKIRVSSYQGEKPRVVTSRSHTGAAVKEFISRLGDAEVIDMGSSLKFCLVAEGAADVYPRLGPTSEWDTAAAQCIVESAGGKVISVDSKPLRYNKASLLNPWFIVSGGKYDWTRYVDNDA